MADWVQTHYLDGNNKETGLLGFGDIVAGFFRPSEANIFQGDAVALVSGNQFYVYVPDGSVIGALGIATMNAASGTDTFVPVQIQGIAKCTVSGDTVAGETAVNSTDGTIDGIVAIEGSWTRSLGMCLQTASDGDQILVLLGR